MGNISRANVHDVLKNKPRDRVVVATVRDKETGKKLGDERRVVKRPEGRDVRQMVDKQGNVVWLQLLKFGDNHGIEHIDKERGAHERAGFVEYHKRPLKSGAASRTPELEAEFAELPGELDRACRADPVIHEKRGRHTYANEPCPHIQWLIESRVKAEAEARELRATKIETAVSLEKQKLDLQQQQLDEQKKTNNALVEALKQLSKKAEKGDKAKGTES